MDFTRKGLLSKFTAWCAQHNTGDEKGEAQIFLDRLFQAFGHRGLMEAGATLEMRVKNNDTGGTSFADLVWKPIVLIEMKKRGEDLARHYRQAFDYWIRLVPGRPRYVVLCNFDEFQVYDFETQLNTPVDKSPFKPRSGQSVHLDTQCCSPLEYAVALADHRKGWLTHGTRLA